MSDPKQPVAKTDEVVLPPKVSAAPKAEAPKAEAPKVEIEDAPMPEEAPAITKKTISHQSVSAATKAEMEAGRKALANR
jgi:hypothetical protein